MRTVPECADLASRQGCADLASRQGCAGPSSRQGCADLASYRVGMKGAGRSGKHDEVSTGRSERSERLKRATRRASGAAGGFQGGCGKSSLSAGRRTIFRHYRLESPRAAPIQNRQHQHRLESPRAARPAAARCAPRSVASLPPCGASVAGAGSSDPAPFIPTLSVGRVSAPLAAGWISAPLPGGQVSAPQHGPRQPHPPQPIRSFHSLIHRKTVLLVTTFLRGLRLPCLRSLRSRRPRTRVSRARADRHSFKMGSHVPVPRVERTNLTIMSVHNGRSERS